MVWWLLKRQKAYDPEVREGCRRLQLFLFRLVGGYPDLVDGYWFSVFYCSVYYTLLVFCTITISISAYYTVEKMEMNLMTEHVYHCCYLFFYTFALFNTHRHREALEELLRLIGRGFYTYSTPLSQSQEKRRKIDLRYYQRFRNWYSFFLYVSASYMAVILPLLKVYASGVYSTVTNTSVPFNTHMPMGMYLPIDTHTLAPFLFVCGIEASFICYISNLLLQVDVTMVNFIHQLSTQINILNQSVREIPERADMLYRTRKKEEGLDAKAYHKCFYEVLVENIKHHQLLIRYHSALQELVVQWLLVLFIGSGITVCVSGYLLLNMKVTSPGSLFAYFMSVMYLLDTLIVIFIYCWFSEILSINSEDYETALYSCNWSEMEKDFKDALRLVITYTQHKDLRLRVSKIAIFSLETFSEILKRAYSYMSVLNAVN